MTLPDVYSFAKALHLVGAVSWMAGLFYLVRIMVYHAEALAGPENSRDLLARQFETMEWKAFRIILRPAVVMTWAFGVVMLCAQPVWLSQGWMHGKLFFLVLLTTYTYYCKSHIHRLESRSSTFTHLHYRALNEVPTIFLIGIVFLAVFKNGINWVWFVLGVGGFAGLIFYAVRRANRKSTPV